MITNFYIKRRHRVAALVTHPIQYQVPLFRKLSRHPDIELKVFFYSDIGARAYRDNDLQCEVKWDIPLLDGYDYTFLRSWNPMPNRSRTIDLLNPSIVNWLRKGQFDAVWVHGWSHATTWLSLLSAQLLHVPILLRAETNLLTPLKGWKKIVKRPLLGLLFKRIDAFLAIGRYNTEFYQNYGVPDKKIFLVPYAVDNDFFIDKARQFLIQKQKLKREFGINPDLPVILFSGKLVPWKRPLDLLLAFEAVSNDAPSALVYVGSGPLESSLKDFTKQKRLQHVCFMGFQNQSQISKFYAMADIFVLPSEMDPWGLVVNEAMCFGLPVIVSNRVGASGDLVQDGVNGYTFPVGDIRTLAHLLQTVIKDTFLRTAMGRASTEIISKWSYKEDVQGILSCLDSLSRRQTIVTEKTY